ncbi:MAG TPA: hypothetical protein PKW95_04855 [bacterium]|nr:hypothetical protein [bacterium]
MGTEEAKSATPKSTEEAVLKIVYPMMRKYRRFTAICAIVLVILTGASFVLSLLIAKGQLDKLQQDINNISTTTKTNLLQIMPTWNKYVIQEASDEELILTTDTFEKMKAMEDSTQNKSAIDALIIALNEAAGKRLEKAISTSVSKKSGQKETKVPLSVVELSLKTDTATEQQQAAPAAERLSFVVLESWTTTPSPSRFQSSTYAPLRTFGLYRYNASDNKGNFIHAVTVGRGIAADQTDELKQRRDAARQIQRDAFIWTPKKTWTGGDVLVAPQGSGN